MTTELDPGAAPGISTISTYAGYADSILRHKKRQVCVYDGDEVGIDRQDRRVELPGCKRRYREQTYNCKRQLCARNGNGSLSKRLPGYGFHLATERAQK